MRHALFVVLHSSCSVRRAPFIMLPWSALARDVELVALVRPPDGVVAAELLLTVQSITRFVYCYQYFEILK
ncbi:hypothetical protein Csa_004677 [Cucumis sativus]|uniref:Uncharacterized protein n=1 Tax=Cucumis sativus TaxID=3659 RepID=A0A0A0KN05_CUCSA|nr:hypothetical protein Csa_004677 [Cucumis sativus]